MKNSLRWWLSRFARWLSFGGKWSWYTARGEKAAYIVVVDVYGDQYAIRLDPDLAREVGRELMQMARDVQEGVPLEPECQGET